jgi:hypothetical protein
MIRDKAMDEQVPVQEIKEAIVSFLRIFNEYAEEIFSDKRRRDRLDKLRIQLQLQEPQITKYVLDILSNSSYSVGSFGYRATLSSRDLLATALLGGNNELPHNFHDFNAPVTSMLNKAIGTLEAGLWSPKENESGKLVIAEKEIAHPESKKSMKKSKSGERMEVHPIFTQRNITQDKDLCFVLMPFAANFDRLYREQIKVAAERAGFKCVRADDLFSPSNIVEDIWTHICKSKAIVADVTGRNPNVFYEIGIAHTVGKPVIIITQTKDDIPFDIVHTRYFVYSDDDTGWQKLQNDICQALGSTRFDQND